MSAAVIRWQLVTPDTDAAASFYRKLFGWSVSQDNALGYREIKSAGDRGIDGGIWPAPPGEQSFLQLFIEVSDVDASIAAAEKLGASVVLPRAVLPDGDVMCVLRDPAGVTFGLCTIRRAK